MAFLKKVRHGHVEDTLIFNNIIINLIISNHIHGHGHADTEYLLLLLLSLGLNGQMGFFLFV